MIREATQADVFDLVVLTRDFTKEAGPFYKFDRVKAEQLISGAIEHEDYLVAVLEIDNELKGMLVAQMSNHFILNRRVAFDIGWYVAPEARGSSGSVKLIKYFENWGKSKGVDTLVLADIPHLTDLAKVYTKLGYALSERSYAKVL